MIGYLHGTLIFSDEQLLTVLVNGMGYEVFVGNSSHWQSVNLEDEISVWVHTHVREDQLSLFGFPSVEHRQWFKFLTTVSGVGPKIAMAMICSLSPEEIYASIRDGHPAGLTSVSGVGKKMAERIILELKSKLGSIPMSSEPAGGSVWRELADALIGLGFPDTKIRAVIKLLQENEDPGTGLNHLLKTALQKINQC